jgi:hypothetical protein
VTIEACRADLHCNKLQGATCGAHGKDVVPPWRHAQARFMHGLLIVVTNLQVDFEESFSVLGQRMRKQKSNLRDISDAEEESGDDNTRTSRKRVRFL